MRLIFRCFGSCSSFGDPLTFDCDYSVLELTPELVDKIRKRIALSSTVKQADNMTMGLEFMDYSLNYYGYVIDDDLQEKLPEDTYGNLENDGWSVLPDSFSLEGYEQQRTQSDRMCISPAVGQMAANVYWTAAPKHTDCGIHTAWITLEDITEALSMEGIIA